MYIASTTRSWRRASQQPGKSKDRAVRAICNVKEETSNVDKLHATREKTLHAQKSRTVEVTIRTILEKTARSPSTVTMRLGTQVVEDPVSLPLLIRSKHNFRTENF